MAYAIAFGVALVGLALSVSGHEALAFGALVCAVYYLGVAHGKDDTQREEARDG